jgi:hypothetical protein
VRFLALSARARGALALAERDPAQRAELLRDADRSATLLVRESEAWGKPLGLLVRAGIAHVRGEDPSAPLALLAEAARGFARFDMHLHAAVARLAEGSLRGGDEGRALREKGEAFMRAQGVADFARTTALLAPGLAARSA